MAAAAAAGEGGGKSKTVLKTSGAVDNRVVHSYLHEEAVSCACCIEMEVVVGEWGCEGACGWCGGCVCVGV